MKEAPDIPPWRFVAWGAVAALEVAGLGFHYSEPKLFFAAGFAGCMIAGFGFCLQRSQRTGWARRHLRALLMIYIVGQVVLIVWKMLADR